MAALFESIERDAAISDCGRFRWSLSRFWGSPGEIAEPWLGWVMLNPSTADGLVDDPTIRRCIDFSRRAGYVGMTVHNLFPLRATSPAELLKAKDPLGPAPGDVDRLLVEFGQFMGAVVCAWGVLGGHRGRDAQVMNLLKLSRARLLCLGKTENGFPRHPLYLAAETELVAFG